MISKDELTIISFLKNYKSYYKDIKINMFIKSFIKHMENGLNKKPSSLEMLPSFIKPQDQIIVNKDVIAIDAGGTNLRVALVRVSSNGCQIKKIRQTNMPGSENEVTKEQFFNTIAQLINSIAKPKKYSIGFCFSYPAKILSNGDAKVLGMSKNIRIKNIKNTTLVQPLLDAIYQNNPDFEITKVVLLNDTIATYLSAKSLFNSNKQQNFIGAILGTGFNVCYAEKSIKNIKIDSSKVNQIINIEAGLFNQINVGKLDELVNQKYNNNNSLLERQIAGKFLEDLINLAIEQSIKEKIFSQDFAKTYNYLSLQQISAILEYPKKMTCLNNKDKLKFFYLANNILERAALNSSLALIAIAKYAKIGDNLLEPVIVAVEGSTFYKMYSLQDKIKHHLKLVEPNFYYRFLKIEHSSLLGSSIASLN